MRSSEKDLVAPIDWKVYFFMVLKFLAIFYIFTIGLAAFFIHQGLQTPVLALVFGGLYLFIVLTSLVKMLRSLPMPAIMLAAPTVPLIMLILILSLLPLSRIL